MRVSLEDVLQYADSKVGKLKCPLCEHDGFTPANGQQAQPIALIYEEPGRSWFGPPGYLRVYALSCDNCSFLVTFKLEELEEWAAQRRQRG